MATGAPLQAPLQALLFDLDGTLIDSMPLHQRAWARFHAQHGLPFDDAQFFATTAGRSSLEIITTLFPQLQGPALRALAEDKEALYRLEVRSGEDSGLQMIPGFEALRAAARARGLKLAICTASEPANMAVAFARFGLDRQVDTVVSPADGLRGKPHPDIFLEAARRLGVQAAACVVFEDAPLGVEAARRAGMGAVALSTSMPASAFEAFPNLRGCVPSFVGFDLHTLG